MKKDIEIPVVKDVYVVIVHEWNKEFLSKDWNAYIINNLKTPIDMALVVSKGYDGERKTSTLRYAFGSIAAKGYEKIEQVQEDVLALNNEFYVTYYLDGKLYEKRFLFEKNSISEKTLAHIPILEMDGVFAK
jgi:folate-binding Fe-S cluster repair protein YgfZ